MSITRAIADPSIVNCVGGSSFVLQTAKDMPKNSMRVGAVAKRIFMAQIMVALIFTAAPLVESNDDGLSAD